jgi:cytidyltransferase-like protein
MDQDKYKKLIEYLYSISQLFLKNNIKHWFDFGTLLQGYRDGKLNWNSITNSPIGDNDIDFGLLTKDFDKVRQLFADNNIRNSTGRPRQYLRIKEEWMSELVGEDILTPIDFYFWAESPDESMLTKTLSYKIYNKFVEEIKGVPWSSLYCTMADEFEYPVRGRHMKKYFIQELNSINLYGYSFPIPRYPEKRCHYTYGSNWKTPMSRKEYVNTRSEYFSKMSNIYEHNIIGYIDGVFDLFHVGHLELLKRAHNMYDKVVVGVCSDEDVLNIKGDKPVIPFNDRVTMLKGCKYVDDIYENAPISPTVKFLNEQNYDYVLHTVKDINNWKAELTHMWNNSSTYSDIIDNGKMHYLTEYKYHSNDIIKTITSKQFNLTSVLSDGI